ncbi:hypothetical protein [Pontibacter akesuensis]|uniref:Uncharacterized protein n=1 Tax=Pontibacter akesuensis TaxID=388950 RepID=A0A1I7JAW0_9BACT|nr:hypothetical protein [Pontibacter akesuensis]GHA71322.1 hypothetical protein GCM10007389_26050 [Pontibacter akesuensis]SFU82308.1 hypothetical protein SAMN04487941_2660 [Pontibacter akesuensis]
MAKYNLDWQETDVQLIEAMLLATGGEGGASLQNVLLMIDAVGGDVPSLQEVEQGLEKLMAVNYVRVHKNKLSLSPQFMQEYEAIAGAENEQEELQKLLKTKELTAEGMDEPKILLKKYKVRNYYQAYLEQFGG